MKNIKILSILCLIGLMALVLAACTTKDTEAQPSDENTKSDNTLVMATEAKIPPYVYNDSDTIVGIDVDIASAVADYLGMELEVKDMSFGSIISSVKSGEADIGMAAMMATTDLSESVDFSDSYTTSSQVIIVRSGSIIACSADLADKSVAVQKNTIGELYVKSDYPNAAIQSYSKGIEAVQALRQGKVDAVVIDEVPAKVYVAENNGLLILDEDYADEEYAIAISEDNKELLTKVNDALEALKADGTLQAIVNKYITSE